MARHWTPKPVISYFRSSPTGSYFVFAFAKFFEHNNAIYANFVQTVKNSIVIDPTPGFTVTFPNKMSSSLIKCSLI